MMSVRFGIVLLLLIGLSSQLSGNLLAGDRGSDGDGGLQAVRGPVCMVDEDCDDGNDCTLNRCVGGSCEFDGEAALDAGDLLLITSSNNDSVRRYLRPFGQFQGTAISQGAGLNEPWDITYGPDGDLYLSNNSGHNVLRYHWPTGLLLQLFVPARSGGLNGPTGLLFDDNYLYVCSSNTDNILRYDAHTGAFVGVFVTNMSGGLNNPVAMIWDPGGHLLVSSFDSDAVLRYHGQTGQFLGAAVRAGAGGLDGPTGLAFADDGNLVVGSFNNDSVRVYHWPTGIFLSTLVPPLTAGLDGPTDLLFTPGGLLVAGFNSDNVLLFQYPSGLFVRSIVGAQGGGLDGPIALELSRAICESKFLFKNLSRPAGRPLTAPF